MALQRGAPLAATTNLQIQGDCGPLTLYTSSGTRVVWFPIADIHKLPSQRQIEQRNRLRRVAQDWTALADWQRDLWRDLARRAHVWLTGYNLYVTLALNKQARAFLATLQRQAGITAVLTYTPR